MNANPQAAHAASTTTPDDLYTPLDCAVRELRKRREDGGLGRMPANGSVSHAITDLLHDRPHAVMFRQIATPNYELSRFVCMARIHGLQPLIMEFHEDRFLTMNPLKCALVRMRFSHGFGHTSKNSRMIRRIADMQEADGRKISGVHTRWHEPLIEFHHGLLEKCPDFDGVTVVDGSSWFHANGGHSRHYYAAFLSLFHNAILFEDFLLTDGERSFTEQIVLPAFDEVVAEHGKKPLIVRLSEPGESEKLDWFDYPVSLLDCVDRHFANGTTAT
jgi:hypothetical protein